MKRILLLSAVIFLVAGFGSTAGAQPAPPPPPPPAPEEGPTYAPPPPPAAQPLPPQCGQYPAPPCYQPRYYRPVRHYRPVRYYQPRFSHLGPYVGVGAGGFGVLGASGPFQYLSSGGFGNIYIGMNFTGRFALELGFIGSAHNEEWAYEPQSLLMWGVTLDAKFNLVQPSWRSRLVPYLQAGVGAYGLVSDNYAGSQELAQGGGFQAGAGIDIYLTRWLTIGARLLYRGIVMGKIKDTCGDRCISNADADQTYIHGLTGELNMGIVF